MEPWGTPERISALKDMIETLVVYCKRSYILLKKRKVKVILA